MMYIGGGKMATAYEFQIGKVWVAWCHLEGKYWRWKPWRRFSWGIDRTSDDT